MRISDWSSDVCSSDLSAANMVQVGDSLMGRVVDAMGMPLDRKGPIMANAYWPLAGVKGNVLDRGRVTEPFDLGVRAVNALLTAGRGQRIAMIAGSGCGKSIGRAAGRERVCRCV